MSAIGVPTSVFINPESTDWHRTSHAQRGVGGGMGVFIKWMVFMHGQSAFRIGVCQNKQLVKVDFLH